MRLRSFGGPLLYVQGPGVLEDLGRHVARLGQEAFLMVDPFVDQVYGIALRESFAQAGVRLNVALFDGECSDAEIARCVSLCGAADVVVGAGGGKTLDAGKIVAHRTEARMVTVPTIASTDSPTSSLGVIYTSDGVYDRVERCYRNPDLVLVDSQVIVQAPARFLVAGMGDALATWFEARSNVESRSNNYVGDGSGMTNAGYAIARACHETLHRDGLAAYLAAGRHALTPAVENIIEANILLSGLGFENCGVSGAHGIHDALTVLEPTHRFLHGEKVAFGIIGLLVLENRDPEEIQQTVRFCKRLGLPVTLSDLGLGDVSDADLLRVGEAAMDPASVIHAVPRVLSPHLVADAIRTADLVAQDVLRTN